MVQGQLGPRRLRPRAFQAIRLPVADLSQRCVHFVISVRLLCQKLLPSILLLIIIPASLLSCPSKLAHRLHNSSSPVGREILGGDLLSSRAYSVNRTVDASGFTLVETIIAVLVLVVISLLAVTQLQFGGQEERFIQQAARRVRERRGAAIRLNPLTAATSLENYTQPMIGLDFVTISTTSVLRLDGPSGVPITHFDAPSGTWVYVYQGMPLSFPPGWKVAQTAADLSPIPVIARSSMATGVSFASDGTPSPKPPLPVAPGESPFWGIYFTNGLQARALAVHPSGLTEIWRWDSDKSAWVGFGGRS
jgi:hypothetical protein